MPWYMAQIQYPPEHVRAMMETPQDRSEAARKVLEALGGKLQHFFFIVGEPEIIVLFELPDDIAATASAMAIVGGGRTGFYKTTKLMPVADAVEAMQRGGQALGVYKPASG